MEYEQMPYQPDRVKIWWETKWQNTNNLWNQLVTDKYMPIHDKMHEMAVEKNLKAITTKVMELDSETVEKPYNVLRTVWRKTNL